MRAIYVYVFLLFTVTLLNGQTNSNSRFVGEYYQGGIIFHIWYDSAGIQHGLIMAPLWIEPIHHEKRDSKGYTISGLKSKWRFGNYEIDTYYDAKFDLMNWSSVTNKRVNTGKMGNNGRENSRQIITQRGHLFSAAQACADFRFKGYDDWYLPSLEECKLFFQNKDIVNFSLSELQSSSSILSDIRSYYKTVFIDQLERNGESLVQKEWNGQYYFFADRHLGYNRRTDGDNNNSDTRYFWTSTEYDEEKAYAVNFSYGKYYIEYKNGKNRDVEVKYIRPIRAF